MRMITKQCITLFRAYLVDQFRYEKLIWDPDMKSLVLYSPEYTDAINPDQAISYLYEKVADGNLSLGRCKWLCEKIEHADYDFNIKPKK